MAGVVSLFYDAAAIVALVPSLVFLSGTALGLTADGAPHEPNGLLEPLHLQIFAGVAIAMISAVTVAAWNRIAGLPARIEDLRSSQDTKMSSLKSEHEKLAQRVELRLEHIIHTMQAQQAETLRLLQMIEAGIRRDTHRLIEDRMHTALSSVHLDQENSTENY